MPGLLVSIAELLDTAEGKVMPGSSGVAGLRPPRIRNCCLLGKTQLGSDIVLEPIPATYRHVYGAYGFHPEDKVGQMYTTAGGFIDFGHLRDLGDLTKYYYDVLHLSAHQGDVIKPLVDHRATVTLLHDVPEDKQLDVARSVAYGEAVFHEIETYWWWFPGWRHSSFSPEDLVSNFFGTYVAAKAIRFGTTGDYNTDFARALQEATEALGSVTGEETAAALDHVEGTWFQSGIHQLSPGYLLRRNFSVWPLHPWLVDGIGMTGTGSFPSSATPDFAIADDVSSFYVSHYSVSGHSQGPDKINAEVVTDADFDALIESIRVAAVKDYGEAYDSPFPVGRVGP